MPEVITAKSTASRVENIITESNSAIIIVSAYFKLGENVKKRLKVATKNSKALIVCYREIKPNDLKYFQSLENTRIKQIPNLHAKYFFNDVGMMVVGSMNLSEHSELNNWELGLYVDAGFEEDTDLFYEVVNEYYTMLKANDCDEIIKISKDRIMRKFRLLFNKDFIEIFDKTLSHEEFKQFHNSCNVKTGYCIRCQKKVDYYPSKPFCIECWTEWNKFKNKDHPENYCHRCSMKFESYLNESQCIGCETIYNYEIASKFDPNFEV